jgi:hypothetical protein
MSKCQITTRRFCRGLSSHGLKVGSHARKQVAPRAARQPSPCFHRIERQIAERLLQLSPRKSAQLDSKNVRVDGEIKRLDAVRRGGLFGHAPATGPSIPHPSPTVSARGKLLEWNSHRIEKAIVAEVLWNRRGTFGSGRRTESPATGELSWGYRECGKVAVGPRPSQVRSRKGRMRYVLCIL